MSFDCSGWLKARKQTFKKEKAQEQALLAESPANKKETTDSKEAAIKQNLKKMPNQIVKKWYLLFMIILKMKVSKLMQHHLLKELSTNTLISIKLHHLEI